MNREELHELYSGEQVKSLFAVWLYEPCKNCNRTGFCEHRDPEETLARLESEKRQLHNERKPPGKAVSARSTRRTG